MNVLGIETSCDETAVAICSEGKIVSSIVASQQNHSKFGGVVPEVASRMHEKLILNTMIKCLDDAKISKNKIDALAVTIGPGLMGALLTGVSFAKGLSVGLNIPLIGVNHMEAHLFSNFIEYPDLKFPFLCLLVSGGHTQIWKVKDFRNYKLLGDTRDDAAGEAFDKGARLLGLSYPGGVEIEKKSINGNPNKYDFPLALFNSKEIEFSFSGLKSSLLRFSEKFNGEIPKNIIPDVAASYQKAIINSLLNKLKLAYEKTNIKTIVIGGGVAANKSLREKTSLIFKDSTVLFPSLQLCTDNAAMIAFLGEKLIKKGFKSNLSIGVYPNLKLDESLK
tara:strand:+ start:229 stop:1233 length:1005 start_codon:yes stop_codon:yes gene_type:complete